MELGSAGQSPSSKLLVGLYAKGRIRAHELGEGVAVATSAGAAGSMDRRLARAKIKKTFQRRKKEVPYTKNSSRTVLRALAKGSPLPPLYGAQIPCWDTVRDCKTHRQFDILLPHELVQSIVPRGSEHEWCAFEDAYAGFVQVKRAWGDRVQIDDTTNFLTMCLWGDSAPCGKKESLFVFALSFYSGHCRKRFWLCAFSKKVVCRCGCYGRCTVGVCWKSYRGRSASWLHALTLQKII